MSENISNGAEGEIEQGRLCAEAINNHLKKTPEATIHVSYSSVDGANRSTGIPHFESKFKIETILNLVVGEENLTILRPMALMNNFPKKTGEALFPIWGAFDAVLKGRKIKWVATKDIGSSFTRTLLYFRG